MSRAGDAPQVVLVGVGGAGMAMLQGVAARLPGRVRTVAVNRDAVAICKANADCKIWLNTPKGSKESLVRAVREKREALLEALESAQEVVLLLGLGGCTGSWAGPEVARLAHSVCGRHLETFAATPFAFESPERHARAKAAMEALEKMAISVLEIENKELIHGARGGESISSAFSRLNSAIADLIGSSMLLEDTGDDRFTSPNDCFAEADAGMREAVMNDVDRVRRLLDKIQAISLRYSGVAAREQHGFNVFSIVRDPHEEVGLHSSFLHALLSPNGGHGQGVWFLNRFLDQAGVAPVSDEQGVRVFREYTKFRSDDTTGRSRDSIDIFVKAGDRAVIIENKIYAGDQDKQLCRYLALAMGEGFDFGQIDVVYLSLDGHEPGNETEEFKGVSFIPSSADDDLPKLRYRNAEKEIVLMSYASDIIDWLDKCIAKMATYPTTRETIVLYQRIVKQLTGQSVNTEEAMEIVSELCKSPEQFETGKKVMDAMLDAMTAVQLSFWEELEAELERLGIQGAIKRSRFSKDKIKKNYSIAYRGGRGREWYGLQYKLGNLREHSSLNAYFYIEVEWNVYYGVVVEDEWNERLRESADECQPISLQLSSCGYKQDTWWPAWRYPKSSSGNHDLEINFRAFDGFAMKLVDVGFRREYIKKLAQEITDAYSEAKDVLSSEGILVG